MRFGTVIVVDGNGKYKNILIDTPDKALKLGKSIIAEGGKGFSEIWVMNDRHGCIKHRRFKEIAVEQVAESKTSVKVGK